jgi:8-oxo-dGTP pyrophosphatase MutT (NUDIX family)
MTTIRKIALLHICGRRVLCARSKGRDAFYVPGGKPEAGEDDMAVLHREVEEELGIGLMEGSIQPRGRFEAPADGKPGATVRVDAYAARLQGSPRAGHEIAELRYLASTDDVPVSAVTRLILNQLKADDVID